ncbi:MAG: hypothetical protein U0230_17450 [Polyangiales bacterium]
MSQEGPKYSIRPYKASDRDSVRSICYETGYMGDSVDFYYGDRASFADMFTSYYTDREPEHALVIARESDDRCVGYLLGCVDSRKAVDPVRIALRHILLRGLLFRPSTAMFFLRTIWDVIRDRGVHRTHVDLAKYPAHTHIDLLPEARGGLGVKMFVQFLELLRSKGIVGVHAEMIAENRPAMAIAKRLGYVEIGERYPLPGLRSKDGGRLHGVMIGLDLTKPAKYSKDLAGKAAAREAAKAAEPASAA